MSQDRFRYYHMGTDRSYALTVRFDLRAQREDETRGHTGLPTTPLPSSLTSGANTIEPVLGVLGQVVAQLAYAELVNLEWQTKFTRYVLHRRFPAPHVATSAEFIAFQFSGLEGIPDGPTIRLAADILEKTMRQECMRHGLHIEARVVDATLIETTQTRMPLPEGAGASERAGERPA